VPILQEFKRFKTSTETDRGGQNGKAKDGNKSGSFAGGDSHRDANAEANA